MAFFGNSEQTSEAVRQKLCETLCKFEKGVKYANEMTDDIIHSTQHYSGALDPQAEHHNYRNRTTCMYKNGNPCNSFFIVKMSSGMDHRRMRPTMMMTPCNMAAIQLIPSSHASLGLQHIFLTLDINIMFNWQLSYQKICSPVSCNHINLWAQV